MLTQMQINQWVADDDTDKFYTSRTWRRKRKDVLRLDRYECQTCKARGKYTRATMVHHVKHLRDRPDLALNIWDVDQDGRSIRQLVSLCDDCHDKEHPERMRQYKRRRPLTDERW